MSCDILSLYVYFEIDSYCVLAATGALVAMMRHCWPSKATFLWDFQLACATEPQITKTWSKQLKATPKIHLSQATNKQTQRRKKLKNKTNNAVEVAKKHENGYWLKTPSQMYTGVHTPTQLTLHCNNCNETTGLNNAQTLHKKGKNKYMQQHTSEGTHVPWTC